MSFPSVESPPSTTLNPGFEKFTWEIENFSTFSDHKSPKFSFPENNKVQFILECSANEDQFVEFNLNLCPISQFDRQYLLVEPYNCPNFSYRMAILGTNGPWYFSKKYQSIKMIEYTFICFPDSNYEIGSHEIKLDYLLDPVNGLLINDKLTVYCEVDDNCLRKSLTIPANPILDNFRSLLESGKFSDAVFLIDGKSLSVHKNILTARSEVFAAMFAHNFVEKNTNRVEITDVEVEVFERMLDFIYTGQIPRLWDLSDVSELFVAADKYQFNILRKSCENYLMDNLKLSTVANILIIADMHQASDLKEACLVYISENVKHVKQTEGWKVLLTKPDLMEDLCSKMAHEKDILKEKVKSLTYYIIALKKRAPPKAVSNLKLSRKVDEDLLIIERKLDENSYEANIQSLLDTGNFSDAFLVVGDEQLSVHRNILCARSVVFAHLFKSQTRVKVDNIPIEACDVLLRYIYTGKVGSNWTEFVHHLLEASQKYQLYHLKMLCEESIITLITVESVVDKFVLADTNEAYFLKRNCFDFICENAKQVIQTDGWKTLKQARPEIAFELFERVVVKKL